MARKLPWRRWVVDVLTRLCFCTLVTLEWLLRILGAFLVLFALALIGVVTTSYFIFVLPNSSASPTWLSLQTAIGIVLLYNVIYFHMKACCTDPGYPPMVQNPSELDLEDDTEEGLSPSLRYCQTCEVYKPPRCHHCSMCNRCVLKMDHHCPWMNQCVGFYNYRAFLLFMFWLFTGCLFVVITYFPIFRMATFSLTGFAIGSVSRQIALFSWVMSVAIGVAIGILGGFHCHLLLSNQTTLEFQGNFGERMYLRAIGKASRNLFDLGRKQNVRQVFGNGNPMLWFMPVHTPPSGAYNNTRAYNNTGDGIHFPCFKRRW